MEQRRVEAFDRWTWDTGSEEDREEFEKLDEKVKSLPTETDEMMHRVKKKVYESMLDDLESGMYHDQNPEILKDVLENARKKAEEEWEDNFTL